MKKTPCFPASSRRAVALILAAGVVLFTPPVGAAAWRIVAPADASAPEELAAREVRRYLYLRTGELLPIARARQTPPSRENLILVANSARPLVMAVATNETLRATLRGLGPEQFTLQTIVGPRREVILVSGGDGVGTLYGAYRLAEILGVRFYLDGDVIPDERIALAFPPLNETARPLFALRGIQPFHDFPEGPDWWNRDDYLAVLSQLPKLRMNFFGLHTYPEGSPNAEPAVWIGLARDVGSGGAVRRSYPSSWHNTARDNWGYRPKRTSDYSCGAAALFEADPFGPDVMFGRFPQPTNAEDNDLVFNLTGNLLHDAFAHAHRLGVKTCVGTETPLTVPKQVAARLKELGKDPKDPVVVHELYEGMFQRIAASHPIDYYWFWTPEGWTWEGTKTAQIAATTNDLMAAIAAAKNVDAPFRLATCGWVLGPQQDRAMFDKILPKDMPVSCINRQVGNTPVERGFANVQGRGKWAIPWLEDDPGLTAPQLWVGRMRRDAADARRYGCDGLMGIHWRTRVLGPNVAALADAAWKQDAWIQSYPPPPAPPPEQKIVEGGQNADFPNDAIADTDDDRLYQSVRYNLSAYHLPLSNGTYKVTLKFCEPNYKAAGKRVFGVKLQGKPVIEDLDIFAKVGKDRALDYTFENVAVTNGRLNIEFVPVTEYPSIAALAVESASFAKRINCGGAAYKDYEADPPAEKEAPQVYAATKDFYQDWALANFGKEVALQAAAVFERIDCHLPRPADWVNGPGGIRPDARSWDKVRPEYAFVDELAVLRPEVTGAGNAARFDWWLESFRYMCAMAQVNCTWAQYTNALALVKAEKDPATQRQRARQELLPVRGRLVQRVAELYQHLLATVSTPGDLGTVMNWENHNFPDLLDKPGVELAKLLGEPLPESAKLPKTYRGPTRVIVPTLRSSFTPGEGLRLKVIILSEGTPHEALLHTQRLGRVRFTAAPLRHVAGGVYTAQFPKLADDEIEYYVSVTDAQGREAVFPPTAPKLNQTLVRMAQRPRDGSARRGRVPLEPRVAPVWETSVDSGIRIANCGGGHAEGCSAACAAIVSVYRAGRGCPPVRWIGSRSRRWR